MHIPRFFLTQDDIRLTAGSTAKADNGGSLDLHPGAEFDITRAAVANQVKNVLRLRVGDRLVVLNGEGAYFECSIRKLEPKTVRCLVEQRVVEQAPAGPRVAVAMAVLKGDRFDWALQKMTELGVDEIIPLNTARSVVKMDEFDAKGESGKLSRWQAIVREAAEQCERSTIPHIVQPQKIQNWFGALQLGGTGDTAFICTERIQTASLRDILLSREVNGKNFLATTGTTIFLIVGPEGGFTEQEIQIARNQGAMPVSLGRRILRSETAAIYALAQVIWCLQK